MGALSVAGAHRTRCLGPLQIGFGAGRWRALARGGHRLDILDGRRGGALFAVGSDEVQAGAGDTLAKVAELIGMYDDRQVLIIGHSDAVGDAARNRQLSERRAELVKRIFVDYFGLAADRLSTEGLGEARPLASNATPQGRSANRRVEILILN